MKKATNIVMIKAIIILFCLLLFKLASAQDYLVTARNDTIRGEVKLMNFGPEPKVTVLEPGEKKKQIFTIIQVKAFMLDNEIYHTVRTTETYKFMKLIKGGYLSLYAFDTKEQAPWSGLYMATIDGRAMEIPNLGFKKRLSAFMADCPSVQSGIENGEFSRVHVEEVVDAYNKCIREKSNANLETKVSAVSQTWDTFEKHVSDHGDFENKKDVLDMIRDIKLKVNRKEKIPNFLTEALKKNLEGQSELLEELDSILNKE